MDGLIKQIRKRLAVKFILVLGLILLMSIAAWAHFSIAYQEEKLMANMTVGTDRLTNTIRLGAHYAMMLNSRDDINQIIQNIAEQPEFENIRIYNKKGRIKFSNDPSEVDRLTNIKAEACDICHRSSPPLSELSLSERTRIIVSPKGYRLLGIITPIFNTPGCAVSDCHVHPRGKKVLGALDVVVSLESTDREIAHAVGGFMTFGVLVFLLTSGSIFVFFLRFVNRPVQKLIDGTGKMADGDYGLTIDVDQEDEIGRVASAVNHMGSEIAKHQEELGKQKDEYRNLFESVPCLITVQDRDFRLLRYNREFAGEFDPRPGDFCYHAYKGRETRCESCPVAKTFSDGKSHYAEESGVDRNGAVRHWIVRTSPIRNKGREIVAAMEISHDITRRKELEVELAKSEQNYHAVFNNIPNPVFVLDAETLHIMNCNRSVASVYGYDSAEMIGNSFLSLFREEERDDYASGIKSVKVLNQARHVSKGGKNLFVNIRISPSRYSGQDVFLVTTSDITKRLEAEQQLIQAGKMATLGEMASGIAHELNQPLSVIKTVSSFCMDKVERNEAISGEILTNLLTKVDKNVDRASGIINHMRQFARKSDLKLEKVLINEVVENTAEIFTRQLKARGIELVLETAENLPKIDADAGRLEQVFINLLINARDAIEERSGVDGTGAAGGERRIEIGTGIDGESVVATVRDTGTGIPDEISGKIFEPFFTTKEVGKGTGLGLSISYGIVKECGGTIEVGSVSGEGACFLLSFPVAGN